MVSAWVEFVKMVAKKQGMTYPQALKDPRTKASYHKMKGKPMKGAGFWKDFGRGFGNGFIGTANIAKGLYNQDTDTIEKGANRLIAGKMMENKKPMLKEIKQMCKQHKIKLSSNGKPFNKKQLMQMLEQV
jgi:hypothetical protein